MLTGRLLLELVSSADETAVSRAGSLWRNKLLWLETKLNTHTHSAVVALNLAANA